MDNCPHCGKPLTEEVKRPEGCVCEAGEWGDPLNLPPVCGEFEGDRNMTCEKCEHDYECHAEAKQAATS